MLLFCCVIRILFVTGKMTRDNESSGNLSSARSVCRKMELQRIYPISQGIFTYLKGSNCVLTKVEIICITCYKRRVFPSTEVLKENMEILKSLYVFGWTKRKDSMIVF
ncbi:hypothetical protein pE33L466_0146 (plasmid) [Bacillus cereus E33L]|uniref:Uncharacterized protein n=1 Tax=Bacillus cereus (strain ZK / E33L) TaxID=288681 RepID=Q4V1V1_BACCZ|nr:hypothetical protein pE33L466_0146 [Bacillus cereus E33L]